MAATVPLNAIQSDRAAGVLPGAACGDALGVPYEFQPPLAVGEQPVMRGGGLGPYAPGEYSDDTQMAMCIAEVSATGADLRSSDSLDRIAGNFLRWKREGASDIGVQTRQVLGAVSHLSGAGIAAAMRDAAADLHRRTGRSAGNGSLMRSAPVALAYLGQPEALAEAARAVSELTHHDPLAGDACVLWCAGIRRAVLDGTFDGVREGLDLLPAGRRDQWSAERSSRRRRSRRLRPHAVALHVHVGLAGTARDLAKRAGNGPPGTAMFLFAFCIVGPRLPSKRSPTDARVRFAYLDLCVSAGTCLVVSSRIVTMTDVPRLKDLLEAFNAHDLDRIMAFFTDDCVLEMPRGTEPWGTRFVGRAAVRAGLGQRFEGVPDVHYGEDEHWACGEHAVSKWLLTGTTVSGEQLRLKGCDLFDLAPDGRIRRKDSYWKLVD